MLCNDDQKVNELHGVVKSMRNIERSLTRKKVSKAIVLPPLAEFLQANGLSMIAESMTEWDLRTMLNTCNEMQFEIDFQFLPTPIRRRLQQALRDQLEEYEELPPASPPPPPPRPPPSQHSSRSNSRSGHGSTPASSRGAGSSRGNGGGSSASPRGWEQSTHTGMPSSENGETDRGI